MKFLKAALVALFAAMPFFSASSAYGVDMIGGEPFKDGKATATYGGTVITRPLVDSQPTIMFDADDTARPYKRWWLCGFDLQKSISNDASGSNRLHTTDRVCMAWANSPSGPWQSVGGRFEVLKPQGTMSVNSVTDSRGDDHLLGSPSVIKVDCRVANCPEEATRTADNQLYVMLYEGYGTWMSKINRFWNSSSADSFVTNDFPNPPSDMLPGDVWEGYRDMGYAPQFVKRGTQPVYSCKVTYTGGKVNRFLQVGAPCFSGTDGYGFVWEGLHKGYSYGPDLQPLPVFWTYISKEHRSDRVELFRCWDSVLSNTFASLSSNCEGRAVDGSLGFVSKGFVLDSSGKEVPASDMVGANQNRIHMAYSADGVNWIRFDGGAADLSQAVILPQDQRAMRKAPCATFSATQSSTPFYSPYSFYYIYGAGYPIAMTRGNNIEVWFYDDTRADTTDDNLCVRAFKKKYRLTIPIGSLFTASKWKEVSNAFPRSEITTPFDIYDAKWSADSGRYYGLTVEPFGTKGTTSYQRVPQLVWSGINPPAINALTMPNTSAYRFDKCTSTDRSHCLPTNIGDTSAGRLGLNGGIMGDEAGNVTYEGQILDLHIFYPASATMDYNLPNKWEIDYIYVHGTAP